VDHSKEVLNFLRLAARITCSCRAREKFEGADSGDPAIIGRHSLHFLNHRWYAAKKINARIGVEQKSQRSLELWNWREAALLRPPETPIGYPDSLEKVSWPPAIRFPLDDDSLSLLANRHLRTVEPVIFRKPNRLRTASHKELRSLHIDTVSTSAITSSISH
jgi:hypothetical protein